MSDSSTKQTFWLDEQLGAFVADQVASGRFNTASEVIRAGLLLLKDYEQQAVDLRAQIDRADAELADGLGVEIGAALQSTEEILKRAGAKFVSAA